MHPLFPLGQIGSLFLFKKLPKPGLRQIAHATPGFVANFPLFLLGLGSAANILFQLGRHQTALQLQKPGHEWVIGVDGNSNMHSGPIPKFFSNFAGLCTVVARHTRNPIDAIWHSPGLQPLGSEELPGVSDHTIASCSFQMAALGRGCPQWRMAQTRKFQTPPENFSETEKAQLWQENAKSEDQWLEALKSVNDAWTMWSADCEAYLVKVGCLTSRRPERALGSPVSVVSGTHRIAAAQSAGG